MIRRTLLTCQNYLAFYGIICVNYVILQPKKRHLVEVEYHLVVDFDLVGLCTQNNSFVFYSKLVNVKS